MKIPEDAGRRRSPVGERSPGNGTSRWTLSLSGIGRSTLREMRAKRDALFRAWLYGKTAIDLAALAASAQLPCTAELIALASVPAKQLVTAARKRIGLAGIAQLMSLECVPAWLALRNRYPNGAMTALCIADDCVIRNVTDRRSLHERTIRTERLDAGRVHGQRANMERAQKSHAAIEEFAIEWLVRNPDATPADVYAHVNSRLEENDLRTYASSTLEDRLSLRSLRQKARIRRDRMLARGEYVFPKS